MTGVAPAGGWLITTDRDGFSYHDPAVTIPETEEGHPLETIYIMGPGNRAVAIAIVLGDGTEPIRVRATEDGYGRRVVLEASTSNLLAWSEDANDGGTAINLPFTRADLEER